MTITLGTLSISRLLLLLLFLLPVTVSASVSDCAVNADWLTSPSLPNEVKTSGSDGTSTFCDFYQFASQSFLYLMSPANSSNKRNFQVQANYPLLERDENGKPENSCDSRIEGTTLRTSLAKTISTGQDWGWCNRLCSR